MSVSPGSHYRIYHLDEERINDNDDTTISCLNAKVGDLIYVSNSDVITRHSPTSISFKQRYFHDIVFVGYLPGTRYVRAVGPNLSTTRSFEIDVGFDIVILVPFMSATTPIDVGFSSVEGDEEIDAFVTLKNNEDGRIVNRLVFNGASREQFSSAVKNDLKPSNSGHYTLESEGFGNNTIAILQFPTNENDMSMYCEVEIAHFDVNGLTDKSIKNQDTNANVSKKLREKVKKSTSAESVESAKREELECEKSRTNNIYAILSAIGLFVLLFFLIYLLMV